MTAARSSTADRPTQAASPEQPPDAIEDLRAAASLEDENGQPLLAPEGTDPSRPIGKGNPPRRRRGTASKNAPRPSRMEVERRVAMAQLWIAQRLPLMLIRENARNDWGVSNITTINSYLNTARERMVEELISDRRRHQAEQIFALNECARRAMEAEQFSAAVGAFRVIAEIGGLLRAPLKAPDPHGGGAKG
jgi:hypothetical protein